MDERGAGDPDEPPIDDGRATLFCASPTDEDAGCVDLVVPPDVDPVDLLLVSFSESAGDRLTGLRERGIVVDRSALATVDVGSGRTEGIDRTYEVESVESVERLSDLGMYIRDVAVEWAYDGNTTVVCFDAVDDLIARADLAITFEFLLVVIEGIRPWGAISHFHFDPAAHDGETRRTLEPLFDDVVDRED